MAAGDWAPGLSLPRLDGMGGGMLANGNFQTRFTTRGGALVSAAWSAEVLADGERTGRLEFGRRPRARTLKI
jgi:hypothetical protein